MPQFNPDEHYVDLGQRAGEASRRGLGADSSHWSDFFRRCLAVEPDSERPRLERLYREAYSSAAARPVVYFR